MNINKDSVHKAKEQSNVKSKLIQKLNDWMTKIGQGLNAEQQSYYK
jgi:predicted transcriptional regulator